MKIAIVGSGIAGLTAAHHLHPEHEITLFEAGNHVGGHVDTHEVESMAAHIGLIPVSSCSTTAPIRVSPNCWRS
jgi:predicted NAD/FAD-binding protein